MAAAKTPMPKAEALHEASWLVRKHPQTGGARGYRRDVDTLLAAAREAGATERRSAAARRSTRFLAPAFGRRSSGRRPD
jgi:hypothetical protein